MRVLLVEDDPELAQGLRRDLEAAGMAVDLSGDGIEAEYLGDEGIYQVVVLDLGLPGRPGLEVLRRWRERGNTTPVVILTARDAWHEKVEGFNAGADDYLAKPFRVEELLARIQAVVRRLHGHVGGGALRACGITLDEQRQQARRDEGAWVELTGTEFRLLRHLMLHRGHVLSKGRLAEQVYDFDSDKDSNVIEVYVNRLRRKLGRDLIETRRGQGYVLREP